MQEAARDSHQEAKAKADGAAEERSTALAAQLASVKADADQSQARCQVLQAEVQGKNAGDHDGFLLIFTTASAAGSSNQPFVHTLRQLSCIFRMMTTLP